MRDGNTFTVVTSIEVDRPTSTVWRYLWEFASIEEYIDNCTSIDSLDGGEGWYTVRYSADFPFLHTEITNRKWIIEEERCIGTRTVNCVMKSPLPLEFLGAQGYWKLYAVDEARCRVYFKNVLLVDAAGFEALYTGIARRDAKRIMRNFKRYVESR